MSAGKHGESITTEEYVEQRGEDEGEEQRGPDDDEEEQELRGAEGRAGARGNSEDPSEWPSPHEMGDSLRQHG